MKIFELKLFSLKSSSVLKLESNTSEIDEFVMELLAIFAKDIDYKNNRMSIESLQQKNKSLATKISQYVEAHKKRAPAVYNLQKFIEVLDDEEYFFIFQNTKLSTSQIVEISNQLSAINNSADFENINSSMTELFGFVLENYNMVAYGESRLVRIGESERKKRVCRFCGKKYPEVNFKNKAHAISEALGNKSIIANEECDNCNEKFGKGIENDIISYLNVHRSFFGIKGKGSGSPKLKGENFSIEKAGEKSVVFKFIDDGNSNFPSLIKANAYEKIALQNIYRALCKYAISVIDDEEISTLNKTIDWINGKFTADHLPIVKVQLIHNFFSEQPSIYIYTKKTLNNELPKYICEFRFACFVFVFIIPLFCEDETKFNDEKEYNIFWNQFPYSKGEVGGLWANLDLSNAEEKQIVFNIKFNNQKDV